MARRKIDIAIESFPLATPFRISRALRTAADVVRVTISEDGHAGNGEGRPTERYGESCDSAGPRSLPLSRSLRQALSEQSCCRR